MSINFVIAINFRFLYTKCLILACGSHTTQDVLQARIVGGSGAADSQWPTIGLLYNSKKNVQCTASIIAPKWVMASYACVLGSGNSAKEGSEWSLYAGGTHFLTNVENETVQMRQIKAIVPHPQVSMLILSISRIW